MWVFTPSLDGFLRIPGSTQQSRAPLVCVKEQIYSRVYSRRLSLTIDNLALGCSSNSVRPSLEISGAQLCWHLFPWEREIEWRRVSQVPSNLKKKQLSHFRCWIQQRGANSWSGPAQHWWLYARLKITRNLLHTYLLSCFSHVWLFATPWSPLGSSVHGILQARTLGWVAISFPRGSSQPRGRTCVSWIGRQIPCHWASREAPHRTPYFLSPASILKLRQELTPLTLVLRPSDTGRCSSIGSPVSPADRPKILRLPAQNNTFSETSLMKWGESSIHHASSVRIGPLGNQILGVKSLFLDVLQITNQHRW